MQANIFVTVTKTALNSENTICYPEIKDVLYMLEGASRWNMSRAKEAVAVVGALTLRTFMVCLI